MEIVIAIATEIVKSFSMTRELETFFMRKELSVQDLITVRRVSAFLRRESTH